MSLNVRLSKLNVEGSDVMNLTSCSLLETRIWCPPPHHCRGQVHLEAGERGQGGLGT